MTEILRTVNVFPVLLENGVKSQVWNTEMFFDTVTHENKAES